MQLIRQPAIKGDGSLSAAHDEVVFGCQDAVPRIQLLRVHGATHQLGCCPGDLIQQACECFLLFGESPGLGAVTAQVPASSGQLLCIEAGGGQVAFDDRLCQVQEGVYMPSLRECLFCLSNDAIIYQFAL